MIIGLNDIEKALDILKNYNGTNTYIIYLKNGVYAYNNLKLNTFHYEYILMNHDKEPRFINKIIVVADWFAEKKQEEWKLEFLPKKLLVSYYMGQTEDMFHVYVKYRKSQDEYVQVFIPKNAVFTNFLVEDFNKKEIDFEKYNKLGNITLNPHQETSIKFLTTRKKGVLALQMGLGKSLAAIVSALEDDYKKVLIVCPASIKSTWVRELKRFVNENEITVVEGSNWKENKFTIINYDILDNFYELPTETYRKKVTEIDGNGKTKYKYVDAERISRKSNVIEKAMENSQLFQSMFDLIIIDEVHRLSNKTSGRYKIMSDLIKRSKPKGIYELTGTMITNNPMNLYNILKLIDADITKDWVFYAKEFCDGKQIFRKGEKEKLFSIFLKKVNKNSWDDLTHDERSALYDFYDKNGKKIWLTNGASNLDELQERIKHIYLRFESVPSVSVNKHVETLEYDLDDAEKVEYENAWNKYVSSHSEADIDSLLTNKQLIEGSVLRQIMSQMMLPRTIKEARKHIEKGEKVIIACCFDKELYALQEEFGDECVIYNGKLSRKQKDDAEYKFMNDDSIKVFIGNIQAASVGLTLTSANVIIFNNISFLPSDNVQMEYRILRIGQTKDCYIYYQKFKNTYMDRMFEILNVKNEIIDNVIITEDEK